MRTLAVLHDWSCVCVCVRERERERERGKERERESILSTEFLTQAMKSIQIRARLAKSSIQRRNTDAKLQYHQSSLC